MKINFVILFVTFAFFNNCIPRKKYANQSSPLSKMENKGTFCKGPNPVDIYVVAGQSNAAGTGEIYEIPTEYQKILDTHPNKLTWNFKTQSIENLVIGKNNNLLQDDLVSFGPEGMIASKLLEISNKPFIIFKYAAPGTSLENDWNSAKNGTLFFSFVQDANKLKQKLQERGETPCYQAFFWMQGESDNTGQSLRNYKNNFEDFKSDIRRSLDTSNLPFILGRISPPEEPIEFNQVQDEIAKNDPLIRLVPTRDLRKKGDNLHFNTEGQIQLGIRFFETFLNTDWKSIKPNDEIYLDAYPVPFSYSQHDKFTAVIRSSISCDDVSMHLVNMMGQRVKTYFEHRQVLASDFKSEIPYSVTELGDFAAGMYVLYLDLRKCAGNSKNTEMIASRKILILK